VQGHFESRAALVREFDNEALALEKLLQKSGKLHIIVDHQNPQMSASTREFSTA
jgi:hypothetical protein